MSRRPLGISIGSKNRPSYRNRQGASYHWARPRRGQGTWGKAVNWKESNSNGDERERGERDGWFSICEAEKGADGSTRRASLAAYQFSALLFSFRNGRQRSTKGEESAFFFFLTWTINHTLSIFSMSLLLTSEKGGFSNSSVLTRISI